jgi:hypothetical protein
MKELKERLLLGHITKEEFEQKKKELREEAEANLRKGRFESIILTLYKKSGSSPHS